MTIKDFIGTHSIEEIANHILRILNQRNAQLTDCESATMFVYDSEGWIAMLGIWHDFKTCEKCEHCYNDDTFGPMCNLFRKDKYVCPNSNLWDSEAYTIILERLKATLNKEIEE